MRIALSGADDFQITQSEIDAIVPIIEVIRVAASIPA
jgi:hypothetical protein